MTVVVRYDHETLKREAALKEIAEWQAKAKVSRLIKGLNAYYISFPSNRDYEFFKNKIAGNAKELSQQRIAILPRALREELQWQ